MHLTTPSAPARSRARSIGGLVIVGAGTLIGPLDSSVNIAFPEITRSFGLPLEDIQWVVICYVLTYSSLLLAVGKLGDLFGYRRVFAAGLALSAVALALCGLAWRFEALLAFRFGQGLGTALVLACGPAFATSLFAESVRSRILGLYVMMFAAGQALGPSLGGLLIDAWGWPAVFWFRCPIALAALLLVFTIKEGDSPAPQPSYDLFGAFLIASSMAATLLALNRAQAITASPATFIALSAAAVGSIALFVRHQSRAADPILRPGLFRDLDFTLLNVANVVVNLAGFAVMLLVPYYLHRVAGYPAWVAGTILATSPLGMMLTSTFGGWALGKAGAGSVGLFGCALTGGGLLLIGGWSEATSVPVMLASLFLQGMGLGLFQVFYLDAVVGSLPREERGVAGGLGMLTRTVGVVLGATVLTILLQRFEAGYRARELEASVAFVAAYRTTFSLTGSVLLMLLTASLLRMRIWFPETLRGSR